MNRTLIKRFFEAGTVFLVFLLVSTAWADVGDYYSPTAILSDGGTYIYVAEHTANQVDEIVLPSYIVFRTLPLPDPPTGLELSPGGGRLYVTAGEADGKVYAINTTAWAIQNIIDVGHTPMSPVVSGDGSTLYVCNRFDNNISVVNTVTATEVTTIPVVREPVAMAITPDSANLVVANHLPDGPANTGTTGCDVSVINTSTYVVTNIELTNGSTGAKGICVSPDGSYAYVTHVLGRYQVPTSQLERGWIMTNAVSVIDITGTSLVNTFLVDDVEMGAANPWGIACTSDGTYLCITHSGSHELSVINRTDLHTRLDNVASEIPVPGGFSDDANDVPHDLGFLSDIRRRIELAGNSPRALVIVGNTAYIAEYFSDSIGVVDINTGQLDPNSPFLGPQNPPTQVRLGEMYYHDANETFQKWLSCASCHPDARSDALNWDLANDGYGSPRNAKGHLYSHMTPPTNITGCRPDAYTSVRAGFKFIEFAIRPEEDANAIDEFMKSLEPVPSPHLVNGQLSESAQNGRQIFRHRCVSCHSGTYYTDMQKYDVGTGRGAGESLDTPTLIEVWRTAPYLQDGRAATMQEVLTTYNPSDQHGMTSDLSPAETDDLAEYVLSISEIADYNYPGDFEPDGDVDVNDLGTFVAAWMSQPGDGNWNAVCDISTPKDNFINFKDYAVFAKDWRAVAE